MTDQQRPVTVTSYGSEVYFHWVQGKHPCPATCGCLSCGDLRGVLRRLGYQPAPAVDWRGEPLPGAGPVVQPAFVRRAS